MTKYLFQHQENSTRLRKVINISSVPGMDCQAGCI